MMLDFIPSSVEYIRSGKLRALGVTTAARAAALPDVPPIGKFVPGYEASGRFGLGAPKGTPGEIVDALNKEMNAILADDKVRARLADLGGTPLSGSERTHSALSIGQVRAGHRHRPFHSDGRDLTADLTIPAVLRSS